MCYIPDLITDAGSDIFYRKCRLRAVRSQVNRRHVHEPGAVNLCAKAAWPDYGAEKILCFQKVYSHFKEKAMSVEV